MLNKVMAKKNVIINYLISAGLIIIISSILILIQGSNPLLAFSEIFKGAVGSKSAIASSIRWSTPVLIAAMSAVVAHKAGINNLGIDGQIYLGAFLSAIVGAFLNVPGPLHILIAIIGGGIAGLLYAALPALLKSWLNVNEMISTLMFNYIAILLTEFLTMQMMGLNSDSNPDMIATPEILSSAALSKILPPYQATTGIFIALIIVAVVYFIFRYTRAGYKWTMLGRNPNFAKCGGIKIVKNYFMVFLLSGFIAGICGAVEILGPHTRFRSNFSTNLGWDGIMVALIAKNNPIATAVFAVVWGMIKAGSFAMERTTSVNRILMTLIQALFVLFVTVDMRSFFMKLFKIKSKEVDVAIEGEVDNG